MTVQLCTRNKLTEEKTGCSGTFTSRRLSNNATFSHILLIISFLLLSRKDIGVDSGKKVWLNTGTTKHLLNEVEQNTRNYKAEADNTNRGLHNSSYLARTEFNKCFIIFLKYFKLSLNACFVCT